MKIHFDTKFFQKKEFDKRTEEYLKNQKSLF